MLEKKSLQVLKILQAHVDAADPYVQMSENREPLKRLVELQYVDEASTQWYDENPNHEQKINRYKITVKGQEALHEELLRTRDQRTTRITAIWGAITGTAAIGIEIAQLLMK